MTDRALYLLCFCVSFLMLAAGVYFTDFAYEHGGYLQRGLTHAMQVFAAIGAFVSGRALIDDSRF